MTPLTIAIMQPYFLPYAGYFRLFAATDLFVIYDCVQFSRRGWVHRNRLSDASGVERWLTLPIEKAPQSVLIRDLRFRPDAADLLAKRLRPFSLITTDRRVKPILEALHEVDGTPLDYVERLLKHVVAYLGLPWSVVRSSALDVPQTIRGQDRILRVWHAVLVRPVTSTRRVDAIFIIPTPLPGRASICSSLRTIPDRFHRSSCEF